MAELPHQNTHAGSLVKIASIANNSKKEQQRLCNGLRPCPPHSHPISVARANIIINLLSTLDSRLYYQLSIYSKTHIFEQILVNLHEIFIVGPWWEKIHELIINFKKPHLPQVVTTYHDPSQSIKTNTHKSSHLCQILMELHKIFSIGPSGKTDMN